MLTAGVECPHSAAASAVTFALAAIATIWIVSAVAVRPVTEPAVFAFPVGLGVGLSGFAGSRLVQCPRLSPVV
jgi:hypothetical protein